MIHENITCITCEYLMIFLITYDHSVLCHFHAPYTHSGVRISRFSRLLLLLNCSALNYDHVNNSFFCISYNSHYSSGVSALIIDTDTPGISYGQKEKKVSFKFWEYLAILEGGILDLDYQKFAANRCQLSSGEWQDV